MRRTAWYGPVSDVPGDVRLSAVSGRDTSVAIEFWPRCSISVRWSSRQLSSLLHPSQIPMPGSDAEKLLVTIETDKLRGNWVDPRLAKITFEEWTGRWWGGHVPPQGRPSAPWPLLDPSLHGSIWALVSI